MSSNIPMNTFSTDVFVSVVDIQVLADKDTIIVTIDTPWESLPDDLIKKLFNRYMHTGSDVPSELRDHPDLSNEWKVEFVHRVES